MGEEQEEQTKQSGCQKVLPVTVAASWMGLLHPAQTDSTAAPGLSLITQETRNPRAVRMWDALMAQ